MGQQQSLRTALACSTFLALAAAGSAFAGPPASVKLLLPAHMSINVKFTLKLTGVVPAGQEDGLVLAQDSKPCSSSANTELGRAEVLGYVGGALVKGHFAYTDAGVFLRNDPRFLGNVHFCSYLTDGLKTLAHSSESAHLPR